MSSSRGSSSCFASFVAILFIISWTSFVSYLIKTASINQGADHWVDLARRKTYDPCYNGCNDCLDVSRIEEACLMTKKVSIPGVDCDAANIWTWAERYPLECLVAVGDLYKYDALWWKKFWLGTLLLLNVFAVGVYRAVLAILESPVSETQYRPVYRRRRNSSSPLLTTFGISMLIAAMITPVASYGCTGMGSVYDQHFISTNGSLYGRVHGWISNCHDQSYSCGESCSTATSDGRKSCDPIWCSQPYLDKSPAYFVDHAAHRVMSCGFRLVKTVPGPTNKRIANPRIEGKLWVKVSVNAFNGSGGVFEEVQCLYEMVQPP